MQPIAIFFVEADEIVEKVAAQQGISCHEAADQLVYFDEVAVARFHVGNRQDRNWLN